MLIIPSIDVFNNRVVRLLKGDFNKVTEYPKSPLGYASYFKTTGIKRMHLIDLNGAKDGDTKNFEIIKELIEKSHLEIEIGGGIRSIERVKQLIELGANYIIIGTLALKNYKETQKIIETYPNKIILSLDCYGSKIAVEGWQKKTNLDLLELLKIYSNFPLESIIYTDINRDGTLNGYNIEALEELATAVNFPIIVSGGFINLDCIYRLKELPNIKGFIIGKAFYEKKINLEEIVRYLNDDKSS
jgi:phosphoribosylformimino-5-aminoimidazole carboxamide ribotide isomerase